MTKNPIEISIIGGGAGGLMAAEALAKEGFSVTIFEYKSSVGRKFLLAGSSGLNITNSENLETFITKYGVSAKHLKKVIKNFTPQDLQNWCKDLGEETFEGSGGKVFPKSFKANTLFKAWKERLENLNIKFVLNHKWIGWNDKGENIFITADNKEVAIKSEATILALGGASWPQLGSDGSWVKILEDGQIPISPLRPSNCGFKITWSDLFKGKFSGAPLKPITVSFKGVTVQGELSIVDRGLEGGAIYALSAKIRDELEACGKAIITVDLRPDISLQNLTDNLNKPRNSMSFSNFLRKQAKLYPAAISFIFENMGKDIQKADTAELAKIIKSVPVEIEATFPIEEAISTAGGVKFEALDENFMIKSKEGVFAIGEMLDWEAQTGGYLLQATLSMAVYMPQAIKNWQAGKKILHKN